MSNRAPVVLTILDGWGIAAPARGNALAVARLPNYRRLAAEYPYTTLDASGEAVGLPAGQMGNSEVGHLNMGSGRVVYQELPRISRAIRDGSFFTNEVLLTAMRAAARPGQALHLLGLVSPGGVHSHQEHLHALLEMARRHGLSRVFVHAFLDGRDVPPKSAMEYLELLEEEMARLAVGRVATVMGRYYAMDRDRRWERTERAYRAMVSGEGRRAAGARRAVEASYERDVTDEFVEPVVLEEDGRPVGLVRPGDGLIFFNFRADRARQLTHAFLDEEFAGFARPGGRMPLTFVCFTQYDAGVDAPVAFPPQHLDNTLGQVLAARGLRQLRVAETEKYAHVTFFFNGGVEEPNPGEERILVPSPRVPTYDQQPEMSAYGVAEKVVEGIASGQYAVVVVNFANPDMVGHTGVLEAAVKAVEAVDDCLGRVEEAVRRAGGTLVVTADHGNAEKMLDEEGEPHTAHTSDEVPFILVRDEFRGRRLRAGGALCDVAPTILQLLEIPLPPEMTGHPLLE